MNYGQPLDNSDIAGKSNLTLSVRTILLTLATLTHRLTVDAMQPALRLRTHFWNHLGKVSKEPFVKESWGI